MTLSETLVSIRELSFDRVPVICFVLKSKPNTFITNTSTEFKILPSAGGTPTHTIDYATYPTMDALMEKLISLGYPIAYTSYFIGLDSPADTLLRFTDANLSTADISFLRRTLVSDDSIKDMLIYYFSLVLKQDVLLADLDTEITALDAFTNKHMALWISIKITEKYQLAEAASASFTGIFTDGTGVILGANAYSPGIENTTVDIGSVFSITEDNSIAAKYFQEDYNRVGSDNVLGNKNSFWFKLFLWLRSELESTYNDFFFRKDNLINGKTQLNKDLNYREYFDSYPFVLSPHPRDIR